MCICIAQAAFSSSPIFDENNVVLEQLWLTERNNPLAAIRSAYAIDYTVNESCIQINLRKCMKYVTFNINRADINM